LGDYVDAEKKRPGLAGALAERLERPPGNRYNSAKAFGNAWDVEFPKREETNMPTRSLTIGEKKILKFVFGDTLWYETQKITTNDANRGGVNNSITYRDIPHYSTQIWCPDFSVATAETWTFVHEFGHVWQYKYATPPMYGFLENVMRHPINYDLNYPYDMMKSDDFYDYNIEQQASIVADYWAVSMSQRAQYCTNPKSPQREDYYGFIAQVQNPYKSND
jgi:hypothetical protein